MANVLQHPIDFEPRPVSHAPSPFGFGFGLGIPSSSAVVASGWQPSAYINPSTHQQFSPSVNQFSSLRVQKRRHEPEDDATEITRQGGTRDASMDRSPTPERAKRAAPKRARVTTVLDIPSRSDDSTKENKPPINGDEDHDVDVGVLLASLPPQSLLTLLNSMLNTQPSLKSVILPLIPRPTLETAIQALAQSAKKLRDAYPYSTAPTPSSLNSSASSGFGKSSLTQNASSFGSASSNNNGGMRDSYIISRLRPHITEFAAACFSYLPYFSSAPTSSTSFQAPSTQLRSLRRGNSHPSETFLFLSAVTNHLVSQPPLTQLSLAPLLLPRLSEEWKAWILKVDEVVNHEGGMFGSETVRSWERVLDELANGKAFEGTNVMRGVRDLWVSKVGWLIGRIVPQQMDEL